MLTEKNKKASGWVRVVRGLSMTVLSLALWNVIVGRAAEKKKQEETPTGLTIEMLEQMPVLPGNLGALPAVTAPADNPTTPEKIALGKALFFETRLSKDKTISCATCHDPSKGYSDGHARAIGFDKKELGRHSPTVLNAAYNGPQFWDGRANGLEEQAKGPILAAGEMNMGDPRLVEARLRQIKEYRKPFKTIFGSKPNLNDAAKAIAAFERTIVTPNARFDQYTRGERSALTDQEKKGLVVFVGKGNCALCHNGVNFTDNKFHNLGTPQVGPRAEDPGRQEISKDSKDLRAFKTPTLRNITLTAPYMHDGAHSTLEEVVDFYDRGGDADQNKSKLIMPLGLSKEEKADLVAFLKTLTGDMPVVEFAQNRP